MHRISLRDDYEQALLKVTDGLAEATAICNSLVAAEPLLSRFGYLQVLDNCRVYGADIVQLHQLCGGTVDDLLIVLSACRIGAVTAQEVNKAVVDKQAIDVARYRAINQRRGRIHVD